MGGRSDRATAWPESGSVDRDHGGWAGGRRADLRCLYADGQADWRLAARPGPDGVRPAGQQHPVDHHWRHHPVLDRAEHVRGATYCLRKLGLPSNHTTEYRVAAVIMRVADFVRERLRSMGDQRAVVADPQARYFGARLSERDLLPGDGAQLGPTRFDGWLSKQAPSR